MSSWTAECSEQTGVPIATVRRRILTNAVLGQPIQGWSSLMVVTLVIGGLQMLMLGVLGEYLWRALDEARRRPRYLIEATTEPANPACVVTDGADFGRAGS